MTRSWHAGRPIDTDTADTYADGIASRMSLPSAATLMPGRVEEMLTVTEGEIRTAQAELTDALGITVDGAAAAGRAGVLADEDRVGPILLVVTGSNV